MSQVLNPWTLILSVSVIVIGLVYHTGDSAPSCGSRFSPHYASWNTWFHPAQFHTHEDSKINTDEDWSLLYHLGGNGPWIEKLDSTPDTPGPGLPEGCTVDQVHMMSRHAERYPTTAAGNRHLDLLARIRDANVVLNGSLSFLNNWTYFTDAPQRDFNQLTRTGPYAGTLQAFTTGIRFLTRYNHLIPADRPTRLWASDSARVIESARYFAAGLFGLDWETRHTAALDIIPETFDRRADTLTPGDTCRAYLDDPENGHDLGIAQLSRFQEAYLPAIAERLVAENNHRLGPLSAVDIYSMQEMCGFETIARGTSPWCNVFTRPDWQNFAYARDLLHYYRAGPGNPYAGAMGWLWLNATAALLRGGPDQGSMFFSFVHDGDIAPLLTALGIFRDDRYDPSLPTTHAVEDRVWRTSSVMPMGGRVVFERMDCSAADNGVFLRVNINDRIVPLPFCESGPGRSCPLQEFVGYVERRKHELGDFGGVCGLEGDVGRITFLRQGR